MRLKYLAGFGILLFSACSTTQSEEENRETREPNIHTCTIATAITTDELGTVRFDNPDTVRMLIISNSSAATKADTSGLLLPVILNEHICQFRNTMEVSFPAPLHQVPLELKCLPLLTSINLNLMGKENYKSLGESLSNLPQLKVVRVRNTRNEASVEKLQKHLRKDLLLLR